MRLPRVRLTVRRMMIAVAILATLLGTSIGVMRAGRRSAHFRRRAALHTARLNDLVRDQAFNAGWIGEHEGEIRRFAEAVARAGTDEGLTYQLRRRAESEARLVGVARVRAGRFPGMIAYHRRMGRKWARAAERPWESVAADDPPPPDPWEKIDHRTFRSSGL